MPVNCQNLTTLLDLLTTSAVTGTVLSVNIAPELCQDLIDRTALIERMKTALATSHPDVDPCEELLKHINERLHAAHDLLAKLQASINIRYDTLDELHAIIGGLGHDLAQHRVIRPTDTGAKLTPSDLTLLAQLSRAINRTAYHGGLDVYDASGNTNPTVGKYLGLIDRILLAHNTTVDKAVP